MSCFALARTSIKNITNTKLLITLHHNCQSAIAETVIEFLSVPTFTGASVSLYSLGACLYVRTPSMVYIQLVYLLQIPAQFTGSQKVASRRQIRRHK